jgi:predicted tellurium resistance membrane protein TerC
MLVHIACSSRGIVAAEVFMLLALIAKRCHGVAIYLYSTAWYLLWHGVVKRQKLIREFLEQDQPKRACTD